MTGLYKCDKCLDRGIIVQGDTAVPCSCMQQKRLNNSFKYSRLSKDLLNCDFQKFSISYYKDTGDTDNIHLHNAEKALKAAKDFTNKLLNNKHETGLLFTGPVGSGKTYLAAAIANTLIAKEINLLFLVVPDMLDELRASFSKNTASEIDLLDIARTVPVLILDDLGAHNYTEWTKNRIYSILNYRMNEQLPTIITSNLDFADMEDYLGDRTCSRLLQMCRIFKLTVEQDIRYQKYQKREQR